MKNAPYTFRMTHALEPPDRRDWQNFWETSPHRTFFNSPQFFSASREAFDLSQYRIVFGYRDGKLCAVLTLAAGRVFGIPAWVTPGSDRNAIDKCSLLVDEYSAELIDAMLTAIGSFGHVHLAELNASTGGLAGSTRQALVVPAAPSRRRGLTPETDVLEFMSTGQAHKVRRLIRQHKPALSFRLAGIDAFAIAQDVEQDSSLPTAGMARLRDVRAIRFLQAVDTHVPGSVRIGVLSYQGYPVATTLGFVSGTTFGGYHMAYRSAYRQIGPGKITMYFLFEYLKRHGCTEVDFLRGESEFKQQFGRDVRFQYDVYLTKNWMVRRWWSLAWGVWRMLKRINARRRIWLRAWRSGGPTRNQGQTGIPKYSVIP